MKHHYDNWILDRLWKYMLILACILLIAAVAVYLVAFNAQYIGILAVTSAGLFGLGMAFKPESFNPELEEAYKMKLKQIVDEIETN